MDHVVYLDSKANELENLLCGIKTMIIRGATGRKMPYGGVEKDDQLYFINNNGEGVFKAKAVVESVLNSEKLTKEESISLIEKYQEKLQLSMKQKEKWGGKRYLVLIEVSKIEKIEPFEFDKSPYNNKMDDWLPVKNILEVKK
ncbi:MAG: hypothetical protein JEY94_17830 [Melioribacteraceae bacterium]|nr:hypothetical protein [Melioribacteraceae bacterium]